MHNVSNLIIDLGYILITACIVSLIFKKFKLPLILGYIVAGFIVSPQAHFTPNVIDLKNINVWAELGVIFLLFNLGLEFSFKKLFRIGNKAFLIAIIEVSFMICLAYTFGKLLHWSKINIYFLCGILAISSTTIIIRTFSDLELKSKKFMNMVFGVLIFEDIFAVFILIVLSALGQSQELDGLDFTFITLKLVFFVILFFILGIYSLPLVFKKLRPLFTEETLLIFTLASCFLMVLLSAKLGFSSALGAFMMGALIADTKEGKGIEHVIQPIKNLFAAIFFVSVGMLIDPLLILDNKLLIIALSLIVIFGKFLGNFLGSLISGFPLKESFQTGVSLTQIGEFSFTIAALGKSLKSIDERLYPFAVAICCITSLTTPILIKNSVPLFIFFQSKIPNSILNRLSSFQAENSLRKDQSFLRLFWITYGIKILLNSVIVIAITLSFSRILFPIFEKTLVAFPYLRLIVCLFTLLISSPFFWPIIFSKPSSVSLSKIHDLDHFHRLRFGFVWLRIIISFLLLGFIIGQFSSLLALSSLIIFASALALGFFTKYTEPFYLLFEKRFLKNYHAKPEEDPTKTNALPAMTPWDASLVDFTLHPNSPLISKSIKENQIKEKTGAIVTIIERGSRKIIAPGPFELMLPFDKVYLFGTEDQLELARNLIDSENNAPHLITEESFGLESINLSKESSLVGKKIINCGIREKINGLIVGVDRLGQKLLNPTPDFTLNEGDIVWIVGNLELLQKFKK